PSFPTRRSSDLFERVAERLRLSGSQFCSGYLLTGQKCFRAGGFCVYDYFIKFRCRVREAEIFGSSAFYANFFHDVIAADMTAYQRISAVAKMLDQVMPFVVRNSTGTGFLYKNGYIGHRLAIVSVCYGAADSAGTSIDLTNACIAKAQNYHCHGNEFSFHFLKIETA